MSTNSVEATHDSASLQGGLLQLIAGALIRVAYNPRSSVMKRSGESDEAHMDRITELVLDDADVARRLVRLLREPRSLR